jgi:diacylglycerol O-acyltransferase / wax synthase
MEQLSGLDAAFVYLDSRNSPMHVGGLHIYQPVAGQFRFEDFEAHIAACIEGSPLFRRRLGQVPLHLGRPFWLDDPNFDLNLHLQHSALPRPGDWHRLRELARTHVFPAAGPGAPALAPDIRVRPGCFR